MDVVSAAVVAVLALFGACAVFKELSLRLFCRRDDCTVMFITHIRADEKNAELVLRSALSKQRWNGRGIVGTVCIDRALDEKERRICEGVCREYGFDNLITKEEFLKSLD